MNTIPKFEPFKTAVLFRLYEAATGSKSSIFKADKVVEMFNFPVGVGYVSQALEALNQENLVNEGGGYSSITEDGILLIRNYLEDRDSFIFKYFSLGDDWLLNSHAVGSPSTVDKNDGSTTDNEWEPLPIDRETPEYEEAVEATEEAAQVVEQDNGYPANEPEERNQIVDSLKVGLQWI
jgi:hypothetical protein